MSTAADNRFYREKPVPPVALPVDLRDYFAAKAMRTLMQKGMEYEATGETLDAQSIAVFLEVARDSYAMADAMLKAREA